ncbi:interleukin-12 subunit beta isoform X2 [Engystomops pustulosus]
MGHLFTGVILLVCINLLQAFSYFPFKEKTLIVEGDINGIRMERVTMECNTSGYAADSRNIHWSKRGHKGKHLTVIVNEPKDAKNYTCSLGNVGIVDYTNILLHVVDQPLYLGILGVEYPVNCTMKNYSGHFTCSWNGTLDPNPEYFFHAFSVTSNSTMFCEGIEKHFTDGNEFPYYTVTCYDDQICHYSEDPIIYVELHIIAKNIYEKHNMSFTLRNIIKPDPPQNLHILKENRDLSLRWDYPKSWCNAHLFYPLIFNVRVERQSRNQEEIYPIMEKRHLSVDYSDVKKFCVQARDMYHVNSYWSNWSCSKGQKTMEKPKNDKKKKKKKKKGKNSTKQQ